MIVPRMFTLLLALFTSVVLCLGGLRPIEQRNAGFKYLVRNVGDSIWKENILGNKTVMENGDLVTLGQEIQCYVPHIEFNKLDASRGANINATDLLASQENALQKAMKILQLQLHGCYLHASGFWTYKFCVGADFIQFHGDDQNRLAYTLAEESPLPNDREYQLLYDDTGYYISELVGGGETCDITGAPRTVELQFMCGAAAVPVVIQSVKETRTCHYEVQIIVPELCSLDLLSSNLEKKSAISITCMKETNSLTDYKSNTIDLVMENDIKYLGNNFYLLAPQGDALLDKRNRLMFTGKHKEVNWNSPTSDIYVAITKALNRMIAMKLLGPGYEDVNESKADFIWAAKLCDIEGNFLTVVQLRGNPSSGMELKINKNIKVPEISNFQTLEGADSRVAPESPEIELDELFEFVDEPNIGRDIVIRNEGEDILVHVQDEETLHVIEALIDLGDIDNLLKNLNGPHVQIKKTGNEDLHTDPDEFFELHHQEVDDEISQDKKGTEQQVLHNVVDNGISNQNDQYDSSNLRIGNDMPDKEFTEGDINVTEDHKEPAADNDILLNNNSNNDVQSPNVNEEKTSTQPTNEDFPSEISSSEPFSDGNLYETQEAEMVYENNLSEVNGVLENPASPLSNENDFSYFDSTSESTTDIEQDQKINFDGHRRSDSPVMEGDYTDTKVGETDETVGSTPTTSYIDEHLEDPVISIQTFEQASTYTSEVHGVVLSDPKADVQLATDLQNGGNVMHDTQNKIEKPSDEHHTLDSDNHDIKSVESRSTNLLKEEIHNSGDEINVNDEL